MTEVEEVQEIYAAVQSRLERKRMEQNVPGSIEILAQAVAPQSVAKDRRFVLTGLTLFVALIAGFGVAYLRVSMEEPTVQMHELNYRIPTPFLGRLPIVPDKGKQMPLGDPDLAEGVRMLRTSVLQRIENEQVPGFGHSQGNSWAGPQVCHLRQYAPFRQPHKQPHEWSCC